MPGTDLEVTTIPELPEMIAGEVTGDTLIPVHLEDLPSNKSRRVTKSSLLADIVTETLDAEAATVTDLTIEDSLVFDGAATIMAVYLGSLDVTFGDLAAGASQTVTAALSDIAVTDFLSVSFASPVAAGLVREAWVSGSGVVSIRLTNVTASLVAGATYTARAVVINGA